MISVTLRDTQRAGRGKKQRGLLVPWGHAQAGEVSAPSQGSRDPHTHCSEADVPSRSLGDDRGVSAGCSPATLCCPSPSSFRQPKGSLLGGQGPLSEPAEPWLRAGLCPEPGTAHRAGNGAEGTEESVCPALPPGTAANERLVALEEPKEEPELIIRWGSHLASSPKCSRMLQGFL